MPSSKFGSKFFGEERYQQYVDELTAEGTVGGEKLSPEERKEGFKKRNDKIGFEEFVSKVLDKKKSATTVTASKAALPGRGSGGGALIRAPRVSPGKLVPQPSGEETQENLDEILKGIDSILNTLREEEKLKKKQEKDERQGAERKKRKQSEERLESGIFKGLVKQTEKVLAPVKGLFERIFDFIKTIIIGRFLVKFIDWMSDEKNREKLDAIGKFLSKTWPAILAAYLLFGNSFGRFLTRIIAMSLKFIPRIAATIVRLAAAHPFAAAAIAGAGLFVAGAVIPKLMPGTVDEQERKTAEKPGTTEQKIKQLEEQKSKLNWFDRNVRGMGAEIDEQIHFLQTGKTKAYSGGGLVQGFAGGGHALASGTDTVPAMLTPGEFVMSRGAVNKYGVGTLASMNAAGGGTNRPRTLGDTFYAAGGGVIDQRRARLDKEGEGTAEYPPRQGGPDRSGTQPTPAPKTTPTVQPTQTLVPTTQKKSLIAANAKTTYYDPSLGGINASGYKTADGLPATSTGEGYRPEVFSAAAFPPLLKLLPTSMTVPARGFPGGRTLKTPFQALVTKGDKKAVVRVNDVGPGVEGHASNHMLDLSVAAKNYFGTGEGFKIEFAKGSAKTGPVTGSADSVTAPFSGSVSQGSISTSTSTSTSSDSSGSTTSQPVAITKEQLSNTFDYNAIRQALGVKTSSVSKSSRPSSSTTAYQQTLNQSQSTPQEQETPETSNPVPAFDAAAMSSPKKIKTLGITV